MIRISSQAFPRDVGHLDVQHPAGSESRADPFERIGWFTKVLEHVREDDEVPWFATALEHCFD
jgi:hypothetical protein